MAADRATSTRPGTRKEQEAGLQRRLGPFTVFATALGTMLGAGIFVLPGPATETAGAGAAVSFLLAGMIAAIAGLSVSELATAMPRAGGPYVFVRRSLGPLAGSVIGLGSWLAMIFKGGFALVGFALYLRTVVDTGPIPVAALLGLAFLAANITGTKLSGLLERWMVGGLLLLLSIFLVRGAPILDPTVFREMGAFGASGILAGTGLVFVSYLGIVQASSIAGEVRFPGRNLPSGILGAVGAVTVLYIGTILVITGVLPIERVVAAETPLADAAAVLFGGIGGWLVVIAGLLATASTANAVILSSTRYPFAMARDGLMPHAFNRIDRRFGTPTRAILVTGLIMVGMALWFDVERLAKLGGAFGIVVFSTVNVALIVLRRRAPGWYRPTFRAPLAPWLPLLGILGALALLTQVGLEALLSAVGLVLFAIGWYFWRLRREGGTLPNR